MQFLSHRCWLIRRPNPPLLSVYVHVTVSINGGVVPNDDDDDETWQKKDDVDGHNRRDGTSKIYSDDVTIAN